MSQHQVRKVPDRLAAGLAARIVCGMVGSIAVTVGNFDGVHRGHAALIRTARQLVGPSGRVIALTFDPNPIAVLRPGREPARLTTLSQRMRLLGEIGADEVVRLEPTADLLGQSPEAFVQQLVTDYHPSVIVEGSDFRFGRGRAGSIRTLEQLGRQMGFRTEVIEPVEHDLTDQSVVTVSSSMIRWLVGHGRVRDAGRLLGHGYELTGPVVPGDRRGREIGMPTANLEHEQLLPADGVYAATGVLPDGRTYPAAVSVGTKPTYGQQPRICEAHLIGYDGPADAYDWSLRLVVHDWLRDQVQFAGTDALLAQMRRDVQNTLTVVTHEARSHDTTSPAMTA